MPESAKEYQGLFTRVCVLIHDTSGSVEGAVQLPGNLAAWARALKKNLKDNEYCSLYFDTLNYGLGNCAIVLDASSTDEPTLFGKSSNNLCLVLDRDTMESMKKAIEMCLETM